VRRTTCILFAIVIALAIAPGGAAAQKAGPLSYDPGKPIKLAADRLEADNKLHSVRFLGNVVAVQGDAVLNADQVVVKYATTQEKPVGSDEPGVLEAMPSAGGAEIESLTAAGNVTLIQGERRARCGQAMYTEKARTIVLTGSPRVWQGSDYLSGDKIILHMESQRIEVDSGPSGRVTAQILPSSVKPELTNEAKKRMDELLEDGPPNPQDVEVPEPKP
jgi:lipopolysaccharide export system protein LptA